MAGLKKKRSISLSCECDSNTTKRKRYGLQDCSTDFWRAKLEFYSLVRLHCIFWIINKNPHTK